ncbi:hypothetical protein G9A89_007809 [Geosiphon pyriformis]|nr:hypothetical protein G9A89_007809 [Geosiphon pyriformis]
MLEFNQWQALISNILPATITENKLLDIIFPFELKEPLTMLLFSGATLEEKPITAMYTDAKVNGHTIKLILDSELAGSIITRQLIDQLGRQVDQTASAQIITADGMTKTLIGKINDLPIEVNGIIVPIKILVIEATQYQALIATCGHFKTINMPAPLIKFEKEEKKPTWEAYQVSWAENNHNKLLSILFWDNNSKEKQKETELT